MFGIVIIIFFHFVILVCLASESAYPLATYIAGVILGALFALDNH